MNLSKRGHSCPRPRYEAIALAGALQPADVVDKFCSDGLKSGANCLRAPWLSRSGQLMSRGNSCRRL
jgi:hypothetical protein